MYSEVTIRNLAPQPIDPAIFGDLEILASLTGRWGRTVELDENLGTEKHELMQLLQFSIADNDVEDIQKK